MLRGRERLRNNKYEIRGAKWMQMWESHVWGLPWFAGEQQTSNWHLDMLWKRKMKMHVTMWRWRSTPHLLGL